MNRNCVEMHFVKRIKFVCCNHWSKPFCAVFVDAMMIEIRMITLNIAIIIIKFYKKWYQQYWKHCSSISVKLFFACCVHRERKIEFLWDTVQKFEFSKYCWASSWNRIFVRFRTKIRFTVSVQTSDISNWFFLPMLSRICIVVNQSYLFGVCLLVVVWLLIELLMKSNFCEIPNKNLIYSFCADIGHFKLIFSSNVVKNLHCRQSILPFWSLFTGGGLVANWVVDAFIMVVEEICWRQLVRLVRSKCMIRNGEINQKWHTIIIFCSTSTDIVFTICATHCVVCYDNVVL